MKKLVFIMVLVTVLGCKTTRTQGYSTMLPVVSESVNNSIVTTVVKKSIRSFPDESYLMESAEKIRSYNHNNKKVTSRKKRSNDNFMDIDPEVIENDIVLNEKPQIRKVVINIVDEKGEKIISKTTNHIE